MTSYDPGQPMGGTITLSTGRAMPRIGLGVFRAGAGALTRDAVYAALAAGYRHIDTAAIYRNEAEVGESVRAFCRSHGVARDDIFVTTKLWNDDHGFDAALRAFERSEQALDLGAPDLYLIHWPVPRLRLESWRALEKLFADGRVRAIGVSNFTEAHLRQLLERAEVRPHANQVELHPFLPQPGLVAFCRAEGIPTVAYSPLTKGRLLDDPTVAAIARRHGASGAQVLIRWGLDQGHVVLPKSTNPTRIADNLAAAHLALDAEDHAALATLARGQRTAWDPTDVD